MSIATMQGDSGLTGLVGGLRVSKADLRVEAYGTVDELGAMLAFARSLCRDKEIADWTETIQRTLFRLCGALATPAEKPGEKAEPAKAAPPLMKAEDVEFLTELVHRIEGTEGILSDWALPGANTEAAAYEMARTVCRRAERAAVRFNEQGGDDGGMVQPEVIAYLNRLSDLIWLFGRRIECNAGLDTRLRDETRDGPRWSRAW